MLRGAQGLARQKALKIVTRMARLQQAKGLVDVKQAVEMATFEPFGDVFHKTLCFSYVFHMTRFSASFCFISHDLLSEHRLKDPISGFQAHIDACTYIGPASLRFAEKLLEWGAQVQVPTTLNAISVDLRRVAEGVAEEAAALAQAEHRHTSWIEMIEL